jgi:hypothetical protein
MAELKLGPPNVEDFQIKTVPPEPEHCILGMVSCMLAVSPEIKTDISA